MDCGSLDSLFQNLQSSGVYEVTVVSNQRDGIVGFGGSFGAAGTGGSLWMRAVSPNRLEGTTDKYLLSDRTLSLPSSGLFVGPDQPFSVNASESMTASIQRQGSGQYLLELSLFGGSRQFKIQGQCIEGAIVGSTSAIGKTEPVETAIYVITVGDFTPNPK